MNATVIGLIEVIYRTNVMFHGLGMDALASVCARSTNIVLILA